MGSFYVNITLKGPNQPEVSSKLKDLQRTAFISPTVNGVTTVFDAECDEQNTKVISALTKELSGHFSCPAWAVLNHDDDILAYELYNDGDLVDEYDSSPRYFDPDAEPSEPVGGNSSLLAGLMGAPDAEAEVEDILCVSSFVSDEFVFAVDRHQALAEHLGLPSFTVGFGYNYIEAGEMPDGFEEVDFVKL